ncbi:hypothetical protein [Fusobacterium perfoetens]|uniref:hypothetical protein n=1 Tax=Fusobacterium perfoetens TaxID=852 RepID=UPI000483A4DA|nr:hypothetical protein [Fusobacterium perfoetens]
MDEKKKLFLGIGISIIIAASISGTMTYLDKRNSKKNIEKIFGTTFVNQEYQVDLKENQVAKDYVPLDFEAIKKKVGMNNKENQGSFNKVEEIKNDKGEVIGKKEYKTKNDVIKTNFNGKSIVSTEVYKEKNGKPEGKATLTYSDGVVETYNYQNGIKNGEAEIKFLNGDKEVYKYVNNLQNGEAVYYFSNGDKEIYNYKNGVVDGDAKYIFKNGKEEIYKYVNGQRQ